MEQRPMIGDIITSEKFAFGYKFHQDDKTITIDGKTTQHPIEITIGEDERVALAASTGKIPPKTKTIDLGGHDPSRATAKFVVISARMQGGSSKQNHPDGWYVLASRLDADGNYSSEGETIEFYTSGFFTCKVAEEDIQLTGKMEMSFV